MRKNNLVDACLSLLLALLALAGAAGAGESEFSLTEVAPGVFVHRGNIAERTPANLGDQANIGYIAGSKCIAVIDSGGSMRVGELLRAAIESERPSHLLRCQHACPS